MTYGDIIQTEIHKFWNVFKEALSYEKIKQAADQCDYFPLTKYLLENDSLQCEVVECRTNKDTKTVIVEEIEKINKEAIMFLTDIGIKNNKSSTGSTD